MEHVGIDLGSKASHICVRTADGAVAQETRIPTQELGMWLAQRERSQVVIETCNEAFTIADLASEAGHPVRVVPAAVVRQLGVGYRGVKNDVRDARVLSRSSVALGEELPAVHVPSIESRQRQRLLTQRHGLVKTRTQLVNGVKSQLRAELLSVRTGTTSTFARRVRERLGELGEQALLQVLEPTLQTIETTTLSIAQLEEQLQAASKDDTQVRRLKTMPGIGPLTSVAFVAAVDELGRFARPAQLASYFGLTPGENTTGGKQRFTGVTKAGKSQVRTLLIQAAWTHVRVAPQSALSQRYQELAKRRPKQVAIVAVARRMVHALYAMMRDEQPFDPQHARPAPRETTPAPVDSLSRALRSQLEEGLR